jgi:hypothetical protein
LRWRRITHNLTPQSARRFAVVLHGFARTTKDIDFLIDASDANVAAVKRALAFLPDNAAAEIGEGDVRQYSVVRVFLEEQPNESTTATVRHGPRRCRAGDQCRQAVRATSQPTTAAPAGGRVSFADDRISFVAPGGFTAFSPEEMARKFPSANAPRNAVGNEKRTTAIAYDLLQQRAPSNDLAAARKCLRPPTRRRCRTSSGSRPMCAASPSASGQPR